jgi:hypothetical protein
MRNLTRQQIENSPSIESHKPVSQQYEQEYHRYYGWPFYWQGDRGMSVFPIAPASSGRSPRDQSAPEGEKEESNNPHLRSAKAIIGYPLVIADGLAHVEAVARALSTFGREARNTISEADELGDADTADLFTEISRGIDKWLWFVEAHSQATK